MQANQVIGLIILYTFQLLLPAFLIYRIGFRQSRSKINLAVKLLVAWLFFFFLFEAGQWAFVPYALRYCLLILLAATTARAVWRSRGLPLWAKKKALGWVSFSGQILAAVFFFFACAEVVNGFSTEEKGIDIAFPLKAGYIGHGGNSEIINYHHEDSTAQQYAMDITRLNSWGLRASGFFPENLEQYAIYGDTVFSPCDGKIAKALDGLENVPAGANVRTNPAGNHIVLEYENNLIVFAHLLKGSLLVHTGDAVRKGQPMARVGNSGHTSEPHLHIHAISGTDTAMILKGNGIPIYFDGKFLTRNDVVRN